ncbi:MAG: bifunctional hydroxymethylpyrimidine kinase/phosphomethylpyrimidine kinase [Candidatus Hydrogenedentes bacterium]|nr:bifunctional hydroxymethylpyrimidine kinase/phosphomethylpyrimidine kinase [Candidatus Hydrogenedentota bacterium]
MAPPSPPRALTIAGSDSSGGAGIEADLKTFTALQVYGMACVTSVTAQNTTAVHSLQDLPPEMVSRQIDVVVEDLGVDAAKSGMLANGAIIEAVADRIAHYRIEKYVLDPVMVSETGQALLQPDAIQILTTRLLPLALVVTPNAAEAEALSGQAVSDVAGMREAARAIHDLGARHVLVKGGHIEGSDAIDVLYDGSEFETFSAPRIDTPNTHGTGCTYSAAITAKLAKGLNVRDAIGDAKEYLTGAIQHGFDLGKGPGPLNHFWNIGPPE